jgi:hypothetical protein
MIRPLSYEFLSSNEQYAEGHQGDSRTNDVLSALMPLPLPYFLFPSSIYHETNDTQPVRAPATTPEMHSGMTGIDWFLAAEAQLQGLWQCAQRVLGMA